MSRRLSMVFLFSLVTLLWVPEPAPAEQRAPNVLFLLTDDQRADTVSALGNPQIRTPSLDALARTGFVFRNAYCFGGNSPAVCLPSRTMLMNGRVYFRWGANRPSTDLPNLPTSMTLAGYQTYHHGKSGNVPQDIHRHFEINKYLENDEQARKSGEPGKEIVDAAVEFLASRKNDRPFFMYLAFAAPHDPRVANAKYLRMYQRDSIPLPKNYLPVHPFNNGEMTIRDERLAAWPRSPEEIRGHLHDYYATITALDGHIGRLLQALRDQDLYDNTIIVFASDHGLAIGSHGLMGKQNLYEDGMKVPLVVTGPGIPRGESNALVYLHDIYPTVCHLVGTEVPSEIDGVSLARVIRGEQSSVRDTLFTAYRDVQRAIRDDRWKLIRYPQVNKTQLFDLLTDPDEVADLSGVVEHQPRIKQMLATLADCQTRLGDQMPLSTDRPADPTFVPPSTTE